MKRIVFFITLFVTTNALCAADQTMPSMDQGQQSTADATPPGFDQLIENLNLARAAANLAQTTLDQIIAQLNPTAAGQTDTQSQQITGANQLQLPKPTISTAIATTPNSSTALTTSDRSFLAQAQGNQAIADRNAQLIRNAQLDN